MPTLNVIVASTRPGRVGAQVGDWFARVAGEHGGFEVRLVDLAELDLPMLDEPDAAVDRQPYRHHHTREWSAITAAADAFVFVTPEYNRSYGAPLKNALDYLYYEWNDKPAGFVSYGMTSGGVRAVQALQPVVTALKMLPVPETVVIRLREALDGDGRLVPTPAMSDAAHGVLDELLRLTKLVQTAA
jgi:NAD(P)H-dependent FMN reductase